MPTTITIGADTIDPDATTREEYTWPAEVTSHPVERGTDLGDHLRPGSLMVSLELLITDKPLRVPSFGADGAQEVGGLSVLQFDRSFARAVKIVDRLRRAQTEAELVIVDSARRGRVENLVVTDIREPYEAPRGVAISVQLTQIRIASARTVAIPETLQQRGKKTKNKGKQPAQQLDAVRSRSVLDKVVH
jgi:hypothetical protein